MAFVSFLGALVNPYGKARQEVGSGTAQAARIANLLEPCVVSI